MRLCVLSMAGRQLQADTESITAPALDGSLGIMKGHAPMIAALKKGIISYRQGDKTLSYPIEGGVLEVCDDQITILI